jgi:endonuclease/exonuclease/phosphatase family metal-dependent hydrolase
MDVLRRTTCHLQEIAEFIHGQNPDVVGLVEVDSGSYRSGGLNQAEALAEALGHFHSHQTKYRKTGPTRWLPVLSKQANAFLTRDEIRREQFHYFDKGIKRLVIELELEHVNLFLVHLSLGFRTRHRQLADLHDLVRQSHKPCVVAGDFNALSGAYEMRLFLAATGLISANTAHAPTYPSWRPRRELDFICHTPELRLTHFAIPTVDLSDHLPLVCDFELAGGVTPASVRGS